MSSELGRLGSYRVGDTERTRTVDLLKEAHVAGYLTLAEIDERLSAALAARTRDDLERLLADLPPEWRARQEPQPPAPRVHPSPASFLWLLPVLLVAAVVVLAVTRGFFFFPWPLLWVFFFAFGRRHHHRPGGWQGRDSNRVTWI
jgi:Domain of unknown function (DUF1707)